MPKQTFTQEQMRLVGNEVYVVKPEEDFVSIDDNFLKTSEGFCIILYTTDKGHTDVPQLERSKFVKPVDVLKLAEQEGHFFDAKGGFIAGYNANKNEFTREQMESAIRISAARGIRGNEIMPDEIIDMVSEKTLSLPASLTIEDNIITEVKW